MVSRREFLTVGATAAASAMVGAGVGAAVTSQFAANGESSSAVGAQIRFEGPHQMGIEESIQASTNMLSFDLTPGITNQDMIRWMRLLTDDIRRLSSGEQPLADPTPETGIGPARFSAYVGFGPSLFKKLGLEDHMPEGLIELPAFSVDALEDKYSGGDVLIHVAADDAIALFNGVRVLVRDSLPFATLRWSQSGFAHSAESAKPVVTHRNLMGQLDGSANPKLKSNEFNEIVWIKDGPKWIIGGTLLVFRRINMHLEKWDKLGSHSKSDVIGRSLGSGAPLTGLKESDIPDYSAELPSGRKVIDVDSHIRLASNSGMAMPLFRRPFSYGQPGSEGALMQAGLLWCAYQRNINEQYLPMQQRLAKSDRLNSYTTAVGSATFAIARGVTGSETIAEDLFS
jgi:dye decolorizing peroxidase